ncbi:phage holin family protein [Streptomyces sp. NBC_00335]|uniref:hypothetical protein n=1 Tax=unclassified Streptomyces TaxID=2593676 RepID=UPI00225092BE|nr:MULTISPECIES: hypothetical protein [unclassified Streptomyces]MCX5405852.1 phage holin family protein [Streptomyces sp. NBC_00086]
MNTEQPPHPPTHPAGPYPVGPGGTYAPASQEMPRAVKSARIALFAGAGLNFVIGLSVLVLTFAGTVADETGEAGLTDGALLIVALITLLTGVVCLVIGLKFRKGGNGVRIAAIVIAALIGANSLFGLISGDGTSGPSFVFTAVVLSCCLKKESAAWFRRPRASASAPPRTSRP